MPPRTSEIPWADPRPRPVLRVVEGYGQPSPRVDDDAPDGLIGTLAAVERRAGAVAGRIGQAQHELARSRETLAGLERSYATRSAAQWLALLALVPALSTLAWAGLMILPTLGAVALAPYPPLLLGAVDVAEALWVSVSGHGLLLAAALPGGSLLSVVAAAAALRLTWRRGREVSEQ